MRKLILIVYTLFLCVNAYAEGTKEFRPLESDVGNLLLLPAYSEFGLYSASPAEQIKVRVAALNETVYYGFSNADGYWNDNGLFVYGVPYRIKAPSGQIVFADTMPPPGTQGFINSWTEAVSGPFQLGNPAGYNARQFTPTETGDYVIEFDPSLLSSRLNIKLFDVTVADAAAQPQLGRLHCQGWQFTLENFEVPFNAKIYPYDGESAVYEVDFNSLAPLVFVINFNSKGTASTGNLVEDRKSRIGNYTFPEFEVFLNPPNEILYPTVSRTLELDGNIKRKDCTTFDYCFDFTVNGAGQLEGFIDLNGNGIFDHDLGEVAFAEAFSNSGTKCIPWNGRDAQGNVVKSNFQVVASFGFGPMNLPLYDAEDNWEGLKVKVVRPTAGVVPPLYWDDSEITAGSTLGDPKINLSGCNSAVTGCHKWADRGEKYTGYLPNQETINTWWYSAVVKKLTLFDNPLKNPVKLSFDNTGIRNKDTTVCKGDRLPVYVYYDNEEHYNNTRYQYEWFLNNGPIGNDIRQLPVTITDTSLVIIKATDKQGKVCDSYDTLKINTVAPLKLTSVISDPLCSLSEGEIEIAILPTPLKPEFFWQQFPLEKGNKVSQLPNGTYHLIVKDPHFSMACAVDTTFDIKEANGIKIDTILTTKAYCSNPIGTAEVQMEKAGNYLYAWQPNNFVTASTETGLAAGSYTVTVKEQTHGCTDTAPFDILNNKTTFPVTANDETCNDDKGQIAISLPTTGFDISWNGVVSQDALKTDLSKGDYNISIRSSLYPTCIFDTLITLSDLVKPIHITQLTTTPSDCGMPTGTSEVSMPPIAKQYIYTWSSGTVVRPEKAQSLPVGNHHVTVMIEGSECATDSSFFIPGKGFHYSLSVKDNFCDTKGGKVIVNVSSPDVEITWTDTPEKNLSRYNLSTGKYTFRLINKNDPACIADSFTTVNNKTYSLKPDYDYHFTSDLYEVDRNVSFNNLSDKFYTYVWDFGDGHFSKEYNPNHDFRMVHNYNITLSATDSNGCTGKVTKELRYETAGPCGLALPTAFSPNNDAVNDNIGVLGKAYNIDLKIFDRWGEVIFRTSDPDKRWDGNYRGAESMIGVYPYVLEYQCPADGELKQFKKVGDISLIR